MPRRRALFVPFVSGPNNTGPTGDGSVLSSVVAGMSAGSWAEVTGVSGWSNLADDGSTGQMLAFQFNGSYDPIARAVNIIGQDHNAGGLNHVQYDVATNAIVVVSTEFVQPISHGYGHYWTDPATGDIYGREYGSGTSIHLYRKAGGSWNFSVATIPDYLQDVDGTCFWSGSMTGAGTEGVFVHWNLRDDGIVDFWDVASDSWLTSTTSASVGGAGSDLNGIMCYSPTLNVAIFGGGSRGAKTWRLNSDRTVTAMPDAPQSYGINSGWIMADPVSGKFLLLAANNLYELDPSGSGTWSAALTGDRVPPTAVPRSPADTDGSRGCIFALPDHGVIGVINSRVTTSGNVLYVYKHG